jgi:hypothetical protein
MSRSCLVSILLVACAGTPAMAEAESAMHSDLEESVRLDAVEAWPFLVVPRR